MQLLYSARTEYSYRDVVLIVLLIVLIEASYRQHHAFLLTVESTCYYDSILGYKGHLHGKPSLASRIKELNYEYRSPQIPSSRLPACTAPGGD